MVNPKRFVCIAIATTIWVCCCHGDLANPNVAEYLQPEKSCPQAKETAKEDLSEGIRGAKEVAHSTMSDIEETIKPRSEWAMEKLSSIVERAIKHSADLVDMMKNVGKYVQEHSELAGGTATEKVKDAQHEAREKADDARKEIEDEGRSMANSASKVAKDQYGKAEDAVGQASEHAKQTANDLKSHASSWFDKAKDTSSKVAEGVAQTFASKEKGADAEKASLTGGEQVKKATELIAEEFGGLPHDPNVHTEL